MVVLLLVLVAPPSGFRSTTTSTGTEERLQVVLLEAARARGRLDDNFVSLFDEVLVSFLDKFTVVKKLADDFDVSLQPTRPGSAMPATLNGHYGNNLFDALVALRLPAVAPEICPP